MGLGMRQVCSLAGKHIKPPWLEKNTQWGILFGAPCGTSQHQSIQVSCMGVFGLSHVR